MWSGDADAVLAEMREPDEAMVTAGLTTSSRYGKPAMRGIWQTMLDAAS